MLTKKLVKKIMTIFVAVIVVSSLTSFVQVENARADTCPIDPFIHVRLDTNVITARCFLAGDTVQLTIDDPDTLNNPDYQTSGTVPTTGEPYVDFPLGQSIVLKSGFIIQISDSVTTKQMTFWKLAITEVDVIGNLVFGTTELDSSFISVIAFPAGSRKYGFLDPYSGWKNWTADFNCGPYCEDAIQIGTRLLVEQYDEDHDGIYFYRTVLPLLDVSLPLGGESYGSVHAIGWPGGEVLVNLKVDYPETEANPDYTDSEMSWGYDVYFWSVPVKPGDTVTVWRDDLSVSMVVKHLEITRADSIHDTLEGKADSDQSVLLDLWSGGSEHNLNTTSDTNGNWRFDFSAMIPPIDLQLGDSSGTVHIPDENGNTTSTSFSLSLPWITVDLGNDTVTGSDFQLGDACTLKVDNPSTSTYPDYQDVKTCLAQFTRFPVNKDYLKPGNLVEISDGASTQQIVIWDLAITSADVGKDLVSGYTERYVPGSFVEIWVENNCRFTKPNTNGNWTVDFSDPNTDCFGEGSTVDIKPGTLLDIYQAEEWFVAVSDQMSNSWTVPLKIFPNTPILDNFDRANGGLGLNWKGAKTAYQIYNNQVDVRGNGAVYWKDAFGVNQEAYVTINTVDPAGVEQDLLLKVQGKYGPNWGEGAIEVLYDAKTGTVTVWTFRLDTLKWYKYPSIPVAFANGDQFGAQALSTGDVVIFKNGVEVGRVTLNKADQAFFNPRGGYIGLWFIRARNAFFDDFGGGNFTIP